MALERGLAVVVVGAPATPALLVLHIQRLFLLLAEAQGYTPVQAHEFAMRLTFYTEAVVQTVADTYENYVQRPE